MIDKDEALCLRCGICCHKKILRSDGVTLIHPTTKCANLNEHNICLIYEERTCLSREAMIAQDGILPGHCPYSRLRPGYIPGRLASEEEFDAYYASLEKIRKKLEEGLRMLSKLDDSPENP